MNLLLKQTFSFAKIGVIGLGNMGLPMAANLAANGHEVFGYDVDEGKAKLAAEKNVKFEKQVKDVARQAENFVVMVPNTPHSIEVCESDGGNQLVI